MIITLTMNPAIDKTVEIDSFEINNVNRIKSVHLDPAGKGINVSKVVKVLGGRTKAFAFLGGASGKFIEKQLTDSRISLVTIELENETRTNVKVVDHVNKTFTDINELGSFVSTEKLEEFENKVCDYATSQSIIVFSGSVPPGVPKDTYRKMIEKFKAIGCTTVLDADGELFRKSIESGPTIIKPNINELEEYVGRKLNSIEDIVEVSNLFFEYGTQLVVVSLGDKGAVFITPEIQYIAEGLKVEAKGTVGAGDSMLGAICYGFYKQLPLKEIIPLAVATSAAKVMTIGTKPAQLELIHSLVKQVKFKKV